MTAPHAMPLISVGAPAVTNDDFDGAFPASLGNNGLYGNYWRCKTTPASNANTGPLTQSVYLAYDLSGIPIEQRHQCVGIWYNDPSTGIYDPSLVGQIYNNTPRDYFFEGNSAPGGTYPTNGWQILTSVTNNSYHSRQHVFDFTDYNWFQMRVTGINGSDFNNNVQINLDVHDSNLGNEDNYIFYGDSICQRGFDHSDTILPALIANLLPDHRPIIECGGIGGDLSTTRVGIFSTWLSLFGGRYVGLIYGTNDANNAAPGDINFGPAFSDAMSSMIQAIIAAGKIPIVPRTIPWGKSTNLQANGPEINTRIATLLTTYPQIVPGPDLWGYFQSNPTYIEDVANGGIHPTTDGYVAYRNLWATTLAETVYTSPAFSSSKILLHGRRFARFF